MTRFQIGVWSLAIALMAIACHPSPYKMASAHSPEGMSEQRLDSNRYYVSFVGNGYTSHETAMRYVLLRAATIADSTGHDYFVLMDDAYLAYYGGRIPRGESAVAKVITVITGKPQNDQSSAFHAKETLKALTIEPETNH